MVCYFFMCLFISFWHPCTYIIYTLQLGNPGGVNPGGGLGLNGNPGGANPGGSLFRKSSDAGAKLSGLNPS